LTFCALIACLALPPAAVSQSPSPGNSNDQSSQTRKITSKPGKSVTTYTTSAETAGAGIRAVLDAQVTAWNAGKLEDFMAGYWRSPKLTFFSGGRKLSGWDATLERYRKNYQAEGKEMGKLQFSDLDIQLLGSNAAAVRGRFELTMSDGKKPSGLFTLIFQRFNEMNNFLKRRSSKAFLARF
jgi:beta-aspartyl-peptidase (threonine type)